MAANSTGSSRSTQQDRWTYQGEALRALTLPLGGIGTGTVALAGDGGLRQWQIVNNVNHDAHVPHSFFAIWAGTRRQRRRNAVVLQCDSLYERRNVESRSSSTEGGFVPAPSVSDHLVPGASRKLLSQLPGVDDLSITAQYPIVDVAYKSDQLPIDISLEVFSPFVPLNSRDSGLPAVIFNFTVTNPSETPVQVSLMGTQQNIVGWDGKTPLKEVTHTGYGGNVNRLIGLQGISALEMTNHRLAPDHPANGQLVLAVLKDSTDSVSHMLTWTDPAQVWEHFYQQQGRLPNSGHPVASPEGQTWNGALASHLDLQPGQSRTVTYILSWHFPNRYVTWYQDEEPYKMGISDRKSRMWLGNQYNNRFDSALSVADYVQENLSRLSDQTRLFRDRFFGSSLPWELLESVAGPASTIRTPTCIWVEDGRFHGFEGCHGASTNHGALDGCCPMNCTHVWNYEMALAKLFPDLEQGMRQTDLLDQISPWGSIPHRTTLPRYLPRPWTDYIGGPRNPAMDGELGTVLKTYRELRHGASQEWFDEMWPPVKKLMDHVMSDYDTDEDGVIRGEQPNTYDISIYGPNTFIGSLYLAALRAAEEMALLQGEEDLARRYRERFELGRKNYDEICWNGEYYSQIVDMEEYTEQQFGTGCHIDQLLGQWWAFCLDLGYVLPEDHVRTALQNIYRFNRRESFRVEDQTPRVYMDERDRGLYICTWPHGGKPEVPTQYSDEVWSGLEYPLAAMLLHEDFTDEALTILADIRDRHDGTRRSPWNEVECGDHYVRPMASWSLLEEATGYIYNATSNSIGFTPKDWNAGGTTRIFFIAGSGWGVYEQNQDSTTITVDYGSLNLTELHLPDTQGADSAELAGRPLEYSTEQDGENVILSFPQPVMLVAGDRLEIR